MWVLTFTTNFVWDISHSKKNWVRYDQKYTLVFMWSTCYSSQILKINSNIKSKNIRPMGAELFHGDCWTDRRTDMMK